MRRAQALRRESQAELVAPRPAVCSGDAVSGCSRVVLLAAIGLVVLFVLAPAVLADGDPASDYLISQTAFLPTGSNVGTAQAGALTRLLNQEQQAGFPIRVAVIATRADLGADSVLY